MEALMQRLEKYKSSEDSAKQAGDSSKARRMGRIVKVVFVLGLFFCLHIGLLFPLVFFISCLSFCFFISKAIASLCIVLALFFFGFFSLFCLYLLSGQASCLCDCPPPPPPNLPSRFVVIKSGGWWFCGLWGADPPHPPPPPHTPITVLPFCCHQSDSWHFCITNDGMVCCSNMRVQSRATGQASLWTLRNCPHLLVRSCLFAQVWNPHFAQFCWIAEHFIYFSCSVVQGVHVCVCWIYLTLNSWTFYFSCSVVLYVCICVCILCLLVCSFVLAWVRVHMWACICVCVCVHVNLHMHKCVYLCACELVHTCVCVWVSVGAERRGAHAHALTLVALVQYARNLHLILVCFSPQASPPSLWTRVLPQGPPPLHRSSPPQLQLPLLLLLLLLPPRLVPGHLYRHSNLLKDRHPPLRNLQQLQHLAPLPRPALLALHVSLRGTWLNEWVDESLKEFFF